MEFQRGGWVHWHLIILDVHRIPHALAAELWGHGHVWLRKLSPRNVKYCTKYTVKAGDVPSWLLMERPRSVKVIRCSPGFWGREPAKRLQVVDEYDVVCRGRVVNMYTPLRECIGKSRDRVVCSDGQGNWATVDADLGAVLQVLGRYAVGVVGTRRGWIQCNGTFDEFLRAVEVANRFRGHTRAAQAAACALHLTDLQIPDSEPVVIPRWYDEWLREDADAAVEPAMSCRASDRLWASCARSAASAA
jgi:hypothetical protein